MKISPLPNAFRCSPLPLSLIHLCYRCIIPTGVPLKMTLRQFANSFKKRWILDGLNNFQVTWRMLNSFFGNGLAIGRLGLALSDSRPPRLVLDSTVCGVNPQCKVPEKAQLPTARDVLRSYPLRQSNKELSGVSFDVKSAHKQVAVHPKDRGYLCFQFQGKIFFYKTLPIRSGGICSVLVTSRGGVPEVISPVMLPSSRSFFVR